MKSKYDMLSKEEKKEIYRKYKTDKSVFVKKMNGMFMLCIIGIIYSIGCFIYDLFNKSNVSLIFDIIIFVFCLGVYIRILFLKKELLNKYYISNK